MRGLALRLTVQQQHLGENVVRTIAMDGKLVF